MPSYHNSIRSVCSIASLILMASLGAFGCGDEEGDGGAPQAQVTANNFAELATAATEVARDAYVAPAFMIAMATEVFEALPAPVPARAAAGARPGIAVDPLCETGTSLITPVPGQAGEYEVEFNGCVKTYLSEGPDPSCTTDGTVVIHEGEFGGTPFSAEGVDLVRSCTLYGTFDYDQSLVECSVDAGGEPDWRNCTVDLARVRGEVSGLGFGVSEIEVSGASYEIDVLGKAVDPDHGEFSFEAIDLDIDSCEWAVPYSGLIGGGRQHGVAPLFWAIFEGSCTEFTACYFETQEAVDELECTLTSVVQWADVADQSGARVIQPVAVFATSYYNSGTGPENLIAGRGLSGGGDLESRTHLIDANATFMWHAGPIEGALEGPTGNPPTVSGQALEFDLGENVDLDGTYIWNMSQLGVMDRGVDQFEILVSSSVGGDFVSVGTFTLAQNSDDPRQISTLSQFRAFEALDVRRVRFVINSAHSGELTEYVGLAAVAFLTSGS